MVLLAVWIVLKLDIFELFQIELKHNHPLIIKNTIKFKC